MVARDDDAVGTGRDVHEMGVDHVGHIGLTTKLTSPTERWFRTAPEGCLGLCQRSEDDDA